MWKWLMRYRGEVMVQGRNALMRRLLQASIVPARRFVAHSHPSPMSDEVLPCDSSGLIILSCIDGQAGVMWRRTPCA